MRSVYFALLLAASAPEDGCGDRALLDCARTTLGREPDPSNKWDQLAVASACGHVGGPSLSGVAARQLRLQCGAHGCRSAPVTAEASEVRPAESAKSAASFCTNCGRTVQVTRTSTPGGGSIHFGDTEAPTPTPYGPPATAADAARQKAVWDLAGKLVDSIQR